MFKSLGFLIGGIFVGAVAMEVVRKAYPDALGKAYKRTGDMASGAAEAFKRGYDGVTSFQEEPQQQA